MTHPEYAVVLPRPDLATIPLAYPFSYPHRGAAKIINTWLNLKKRDGTIDALYAYWILGKNATPQKPRWSVIRDVLHWVE